ncbi:arylamine N-acetyltransferase [Streptomyces sp. NPDC053474]|uniref:arylamine N-acetyltransferase n=1 Tax=Streptomyces sp. NPDC053474 TaxID=3365704 RepID=UPI0037D08CBB
MTWNEKELDVEAYLARIAYEGETKPDLATLRALHRAHVTAIPFENLEIMLGRPVLLDVAALQDKMVRRPRGGYCYEQNLLFAAALERIGFSVTGLGARVRAGAPSVRPVTHMLLKVEADGEQWHCDVGFGGEGLLEPLLLHDGVDERQGAWRFSLKSEPDGVMVLRTEHPDGWFDLYSYTSTPCLPVDYTVMNHFISTHPKSPFVRRPILQKATPEVRLRLAGTELVVTSPDGELEKRAVTGGELRDVLVREFGIELSEEELADLIRGHYPGA